MTAPRISLEPTPEEARSFSKDAGWRRVAELAIHKDFPPRDWRTALDAFKLHVDLQRVMAPASAGLNPDEVRAWFALWYQMLALRRVIALKRTGRFPGAGSVPEEDT